MGARRIWQIVGVLAFAVWLVMLKPFDTAVTVRIPDDVTADGTSRCGVPVLTAFRAPSDGGWFAYAPNTDAVFSPDGVGCRAPARRRLALGAGLVAAGIVGGVVGRSRPRGDGTRPALA